MSCCGADESVSALIFHIVDDASENQAEIPVYSAETINSAFNAHLNAYPYDPNPFQSHSQPLASTSNSAAMSTSNPLIDPGLSIDLDQNPSETPNPKPFKRKFGGPLQYAWISEYRCCFSGKHRERDHASKSGRKRKRAPSTKVGCKAKFMLRKVIKTGLIEATYQCEFKFPFPFFRWLFAKVQSYSSTSTDFGGCLSSVGQHTGHDPADPSELDRARKKKNNPDLRGIVWGQEVARSQAEIQADLAAYESRDVKRRRGTGTRGNGKGKGKQVDKLDIDGTGAEDDQALVGSGGEGGEQTTLYGTMQQAANAGTGKDEPMVTGNDPLNRALQFNPNARFGMSQSRLAHQPLSHPHSQTQPDFHGFETRYETVIAEGYGHSQNGFSRNSQQTSDLRTTGSRQETEQQQMQQHQQIQSRSQFHGQDQDLAQQENTLALDSQVDPDLLSADNQAIMATVMESMSNVPLHVDGSMTGEAENLHSQTHVRRPEVLLAEFERSYQDMGKLLVTAQKALEDVRRSGGRPEEEETSTMEDIWKRYDETVAEYKRLEDDMKQGGLLPSGTSE